MRCKSPPCHWICIGSVGYNKCHVNECNSEQCATAQGYILKLLLSGLNATTQGKQHYTRPTLERRESLGHPRTINFDIIKRFESKSHTCHFRKSKCLMAQLNTTIDAYMYIDFLASYSNDLFRCISKFTGWAIMEELSIRRRGHIFLIIWGRTKRVKHCYVDLAS